MSGPADINSLTRFLEKPSRFLFFAGKGGVGKTTLAAALASELARRGFNVHLSTTDPATHVAAAAGHVEGLAVSRIDPQAETKAYVDQVMATAGRDLDESGRALLEEDLRSPCREEIAVFRASARTVAWGARARPMAVYPRSRRKVFPANSPGTVGCRRAGRAGETAATLQHQSTPTNLET